MKKEYKTPVAEQVPLLTEQSLCYTSIEKLMQEQGYFDEDSD